MEVIRERLPATLQLGLISFLISIIIGLPLGVLSAVRRGSLLDTAAKGMALIGQSAPVFWLGLMLMFFFAVTLDVLPPYGRQQATSIILPAVTLGWFFVAANLRLVRSAMLDVLDSEYIKLARAKGVPPQTIIWKHGLRNALIPAITYAGVTLGGLVTGSVVVETVFAWPGLGQLAIQALFGNDYPLLQGVVIVFTLMYVLASLMVDVLYSMSTPEFVTLRPPAASRFQAPGGSGQLRSGRWQTKIRRGSWLPLRLPELGEVGLCAVSAGCRLFQCSSWSFS